jgi:AraC-like DNA-binding protein
MRPATTLEKLCRARDLVRDCFHLELTLQDLCLEAELSPWHLLRAFRAAFGETPHEFLTRLRIERAKELLTVTSRQVTEICFDVGFNSLGSFSTLFHRQVQQSPVAFRRAIRPFITVPGKHPWVYVPVCFCQHFGGK